MIIIEKHLDYLRSKLYLFKDSENLHKLIQLTMCTQNLRIEHF